MENYIVSARKYRPATFKTVVGQNALTATLKNAIATDRLAHSYLFCGSRGVGKTSCARIFAKTINCSNRTADGEACNECDSCRDFNENRSLNILELDAASNNGVDDIRALVDQVQIPPTSGRYRVFIIDEVHMLSTAAFNAFLKTLEEPPSYVVFILATTEKHKIIPTILSRCQIYDFNRITIQDMVEHLTYVASQENISAEPAALNVIAQKADGAMRDALSIFDQVAASSMGHITYKSAIENLNVLDEEYYSRLFDAFMTSDVRKALLVYDEIRRNGFDSHFFINGLASFLRNLMVARDPSTLNLLEASDEVRSRMAEMARRPESPDFFYSAMAVCNKADLDYRIATNKQFLVEVMLIQLCQLLSPSHKNSGNGEGQLKKIEPIQSPTATNVQPVATQAPTVSTPQNYTTPTQTPVVAKEPSAIPPVSKPIPAPVSKTPVKRPMSISIKKPTEQKEVVSEIKLDVPKRNAQYSDKQLSIAWSAFMDAHPSEHILVNTMRMAAPSRMDGDKHLLVVENPTQEEVLNRAMPELLKYLHDSLSNDFITFVIEQNKGEALPHTWNEKEVFAHMIQSSPQVADFVKKFNLTLS